MWFGTESSHACNATVASAIFGLHVAACGTLDGTVDTPAAPLDTDATDNTHGTATHPNNNDNQPRPDQPTAARDPRPRRNKRPTPRR